MLEQGHVRAFQFWVSNDSELYPPPQKKKEIGGHICHTLELIHF